MDERTYIPPPVTAKLVAGKRVYPPAVEDAIRGIRAAYPPRKVMVYSRLREWGGALVKAGGRTYVVSSTGAIHLEDR